LQSAIDFGLRFRSAIASLATRGFPACIFRALFGFEFIGFAGRKCLSTCAFGTACLTLPFSSASSTCVKGLRYGCLSLSITSVSSRAHSLLTACVSHSVSIALAIPLILSPPVQLQFQSLSSHAGRTFTDIIVTLRVPWSALSWISDAILAFGFRPFQPMALPCDLFRFRFLSTKSFGTHTPSLASLLTTAFAILRNYDCLTEAIRITFVNCATLSNAFSILFGCRIPFTFCLPPCVLRICFAFQMDMISDSLRFSIVFAFPNSSRCRHRLRLSERLRYLQMRSASTSSAVCTRLRFLWQLSASFRSRKLDRLRCVSVCFDIFSFISYSSGSTS
jgi:hypothetical protein